MYAYNIYGPLTSICNCMINFRYEILTPTVQVLDPVFRPSVSWIKSCFHTKRQSSVDNVYWQFVARFRSQGSQRRIFKIQHYRTSIKSPEALQSSFVPNTFYPILLYQLPFEVNFPSLAFFPPAYISVFIFPGAYSF